MTEDVPLHHGPIYEVGHCRARVEALHGMAPHVEVVGDPNTLPPEQMRAFALVLAHLAAEIAQAGG